MDPLLLIVIFGLVGFVFWIFIKNRKSIPKVSSPSKSQKEKNKSPISQKKSDKKKEVFI